MANKSKDVLQRMVAITIKTSGALVTKRYLETEDGNWVYVNDKGDKLKGEQTIDGIKVYFDVSLVHNVRDILHQMVNTMTKILVLL